MGEKIILTIKGKDYEFQFPNVGQFYAIEAEKQRLGRGYYNALLSNPTRTAQDALDFIDIQAILTILCPSLIADLKVNSLSELGIADFVELRDIYEKQILPYMKEVNNLLKRPS